MAQHHTLEQFVLLNQLFYLKLEGDSVYEVYQAGIPANLLDFYLVNNYI